jgi:hypothetical protein
MKTSMDPEVGTAERYRTFAEVEARGMSECYESWARGVASDEKIRSLIDQLPGRKRQPNLVFSAARFNGADAGDYPTFAIWLAEHWVEVKQTCLTHATQTNEAARCTALLPVLAGIEGPVALIEVGAAAGLCLHPDRYSYRYTLPDGRQHLVHPDAGPSDVVLECTASGPVPLPDRMPQVVWRAGIDLNPLDASRESDVAWLDALIWPEHDDRRSRLRRAADIARREPVEIVAGDLNVEIEQVVARAPAGASVVVFHTVVLAYLDAESVARFAATMAGLPVKWLANEAQGVVPGVMGRLPSPPRRSSDFVLSLDCEPLAFTQPHGRELHWLG